MKSQKEMDTKRAIEKWNTWCLSPAGIESNYWTAVVDYQSYSGNTFVVWGEDMDVLN